MTLSGICIGGPFHGRAITHYSLRMERALSRWPYSTRENIYYRHMCNAFGDWWVVE